MQLDSKKIEAALKSLGTAGKNAVAALNAMTDNEFKDSMMENDPLSHLGLIVRTLQNAKAKAEANARFDGKSAEEIGEMQEQERIAELETIQAKFNERLAARQPAAPEPDTIENPEQLDDTGTGEPNGGGDDDPNKRQA